MRRRPPRPPLFPDTTLFRSPVHTPLSQVSVCVQALPSLQAVPSAFAGFEHVPLAGSQTPATWHWSEAVQTTGLLPVHTPLSQVSVRVQESPSLQAGPLGLGRFGETAALVFRNPASRASSRAA